MRKLEWPWRAIGRSRYAAIVLLALSPLSYAQAPANHDFLHLDEIDIGTVFDLAGQEANPVEVRHAFRNLAADWLERQVPYFRLDRSAGLLAPPNPLAHRWDFNFDVGVTGSDMRFRVSDGGFRFSPHRIDASQPDEVEAYIGVRILW